MRPSRRAEPALVSLIHGCGPLPAVPADPFYVPPSPLPLGRPGELLRSEPTVVSLLPGCPLPAIRAWRLMYRSTSITGRSTAVTGTLIVPTARWPEGSRPLVGYAVGGHGPGRQSVPSVQFHQGTQVELAVVAAHLAQGWGVAVTDGQPVPANTLRDPAGSGHAVLDGLRAASRVPGTGLAPPSSLAPIGIAGYGRGGLAAAAAAERQPAYAPDLDLRGATVGGVPADQAIGWRAPQAPVLVFHGLGGGVPYGVTRRLSDTWRGLGGDIHLGAYPVVEHRGTLVEAIPQIHHWLGARLTA